MSVAKQVITDIYGPLTPQNEETWHARYGVAIQVEAAILARLRERVKAKRETVSGHLHAAFQSGKTASTLYWKETGREQAFAETLALLAEPGEERTEP